MKNHSILILSFFLLSLPFLASGQEKMKSPIRIDQLIDSIRSSLDHHYVFPEKAAGISKFLRSRAKKKAYSAFLSDPGTLAKKIQADIYAIHRDPHMVVDYHPAFAAKQGKIEPSEEEKDQSKKYWRENNYSFKKVELLPGNIGYFRFNEFVEHIEEAKPIIASALGFLANTSAIIIDLRDNQGGEPDMVSQLESYFFKEKTHMNDLVNRSSKDTTFYYADPAKTNGLTLSMPVYILTSKKTFSAAEDFSYAMQQSGRATIVGEVTGGGAHPTMPFSIGQGFIITVPFARSLNPVTNTDWEGTGIIPDIPAESAKALTRAQEAILKARQLSARDGMEKQRLEYLINALRVNEDLSTLPTDQFDQFAGTYGPLVIYRDGNKLFCKHGDMVTELKHISGNLFVLDGNAHIDFIKDSRGSYSMARLFVSNGGVFEEKRQ